MRLSFTCPACQHSIRTEVADDTQALQCGRCRWTRSVESGTVAGCRPRRCAACGAADLWRQKDFPQRLGLALVVLGAVLSTIAWANYWIVSAIGILMFFALADLLLFTFMGDVLVCYRCHAKHYPAEIDPDHQRFDLELAERYRQEQRRLEAARLSGNGAG